MGARTWLPLAAPIVLSLLTACGERDAPTWTKIEDSSPADVEVLGPEIPDGAAADPALSWEGYPEGSWDLSTIRLGDYQDADGSRGLSLLLVVQLRASCPACQHEASDTASLLADWYDRGVRIVHLLHRETKGVVATTDTALEWKTQYQADWAVAADPAFTFDTAANGAIPLNVFINPRTLVVEHRHEGYGSGLIGLVEAYLDAH